jgi:hypothetical protein
MTMSGDEVLLESRSMRAALSGRIEVLERVKPLDTQPNGLHLLTDDVAAYFEVSPQAIQALVVDHRTEIEGYGYQLLSGQRLAAFKNSSGIQSRARQLALFNRRTVLQVAMLLRDSDIARQVREQLLDLEAAARFFPVDNPFRGLPQAVDGSVAELAATALRGVVGTTVIPLLNALLEQSNLQEVTLAELSWQLARVEQAALGEAAASAQRGLRLLRYTDEETEEGAGAPGSDERE